MTKRSARARWTGEIRELAAGRLPPRIVAVGVVTILAGFGAVIAMRDSGPALPQPVVSQTPSAAPRAPETASPHGGAAKVAVGLPPGSNSTRRMPMPAEPGLPRAADAPVVAEVAVPYPRPRVIAGLPPVLPPERPEHLLYPGSRPKARPVAAANPEQTAPDPTAGKTTSAGDAAPVETAGLRRSLRPQVRPGPRRIVHRVAAEAAQSAAPSAKEAPRTASVAPDPKPAAVSRPQPDTAEAPTLYDPRVRLVRGAGNCSRRLTRDIPRRGRGLPGGQVFLAGLGEGKTADRDRAVARQVLSGNVPDRLRQLKPVSFRGQLRDGSRTTVTLCVMRDYLALGSDSDFVRVPLGLRAASLIADRFDMILPTAQMVDLIYRAADTRLVPRPMSPGPQMTSTTYLLRHNATVEAQRRRSGAGKAQLISGHKKDLVLTNRLAERPGRVAIYGWHRPGGDPIQPLSTVHGAGYADYSHGVRLISRTAYLDGRAVDIRQLLGDPVYAGLLTREGPIAGRGLMMASLARN